jgi:hypothetical protein
MWSSRAVVVAAAGAALAWGAPARADETATAPGFGVERLYLAPAGAGWLVMDDLQMHGGLGGAMAFTTGYSHDALRIPGSGGAPDLPVVQDQIFGNFGFAVTYERFRFSFDFSMPILISGQNGTVDGMYYASPSSQVTPGQTPVPQVNLGQQPDTLTDARIGFDARLVGDAGGPFRLGASAQLWVPNGKRDDFETDDTYRAMFRALAAGDLPYFTYAAQVGVHVRPADDAPLPNYPRGSELLFGAAAGARLPAGEHFAFVVGPEVFGATAFSSFFGQTTTALEGLLTARFERKQDDGPLVRVKLSGGGGLHADFGAPEWRVVLGIEVSDHVSGR